MAENGKNGDWIRWVLGIIIVTVLPFMVTAIWSNDKDSRSRDTKICEELEVKNAQMYAVVSDIRVQLAKIQTDTAYLKANLKK